MDMIDRLIAEADKRIQARIDENHAVARAKIKFQFAFARRSTGQRLRFTRSKKK